MMASLSDAAVFLSTPSARRATVPGAAFWVPGRISIHALREEGDIPEYYRDYLSQKISIHALREEGDLDDAYSMMEVQRFLSTPSARRATPGGGRRSGGG